jgi:hypothetical protein
MAVIGLNFSGPGDSGVAAAEWKTLMADDECSEFLFAYVRRFWRSKVDPELWITGLLKEGGRRTRKTCPGCWVVAIECADKKVANKVISTTKVADLPPSLSTKARGSIRKWRPDNNVGTRKRRNASTMGARRRR